MTFFCTLRYVHVFFNFSSLAKESRILKFEKYNFSIDISHVVLNHASVFDKLQQSSLNRHRTMIRKDFPPAIGLSMDSPMDFCGVFPLNFTSSFPEKMAIHLSADSNSKPDLPFTCKPLCLNLKAISRFIEGNFPNLQWTGSNFSRKTTDSKIGQNHLLQRYRWIQPGSQDPHTPRFQNLFAVFLPRRSTLWIPKVWIPIFGPQLRLSNWEPQIGAIKVWWSNGILRNFEVLIDARQWTKKKQL